MLRAIGIAAALVLLAASATSAEPDARTVVDLSHAFDENTVYWPTAPTRFEYERLAWGETQGGWFYAAGAFRTPEHGGTHLDAPLHFGEGRRPVDAIPVAQLVGPAVVIDVTAKAGADPDYRLTPEDVAAFESAHGRVPQGAIVLLRTGWDRFWPDPKAYLGDDTPGDASDLHFPSFGEVAAKLLVEERGAGVLGVDTASIDPGDSRDFPVHRLLAAHEVPALENLANLGRLPPTGATLVALPMKIRGASGAPLRAIALVDAGPEATSEAPTGP